MSDASQSGSDPHPCLHLPIVDRFELGDWEVTERVMSGGVKLDFAQPWRSTCDPDLKPGHAWLGVDADALLVYTVFQDDEPRNTSAAWNDPTWVRGDVVELFFRPRGVRAITNST